MYDNQLNHAQHVKVIYVRTWAISDPARLIQNMQHMRIGISNQRRIATVYTLIVDRSFVSVSGGARARVGSSARATCRNCWSKSLRVPSIANATFKGPPVPCVGPPPGA